jgi:amidohydrolase
MNFEQDFKDWVIAFRRDIHQNPEPAYEETRTADRISEELTALGVQHRTGVGRTGVVAVLGDSNRPCIAFRGDMDALPLSETENDYNREYCSRKPGLMHACGHDVHISLLMGLARYLTENPELLESSGIQAKLIFQPAEEGGGGATEMIKDGCLKDPEVKAIFGQHCISQLDAGRIGYCYGVSHAASDTVKITVTGIGGHGARPADTRDPIVAAAHLITQLQSVVSRSIEARQAAVVSIGRFHAGTKSNIIPGTAELEGTIRTFDEQVRQRVFSRIRELAAGLETSFGTRAEVEIEPGYPSNVNNLKVCDFYTDMVRQFLGEENVIRMEESCGAEDFAYYTREIPGLIHRLGTRNKAKGLGWDNERGELISLHNNRFDIDEEAMFTGIRCYIECIRSAGDLLQQLGEEG